MLTAPLSPRSSQRGGWAGEREGGTSQLSCQKACSIDVGASCCSQPQLTPWGRLGGREGRKGRQSLSLLPYITPCQQHFLHAHHGVLLPRGGIFSPITDEKVKSWGSRGRAGLCAQRSSCSPGRPSQGQLAECGRLHRSEVAIAQGSRSACVCACVCV